MSKSQDFVLDNNFIAYKNANKHQLGFEIMMLDGEETKLIISENSQDIEQKAVGSVVVYNNYSDKPQKLLIDTRLETPNGKIYKTDSPVTVPGFKTENGEVIPGSVEVGVFADLPGEEYNSDLTDFTIIGFKNSSKYDKFYARSKTKISGGLVGKFYVASEEEQDKVEAELTKTLQDKLFQQIDSQIPSGFVYYKDAIFFEFIKVQEFLKGETSSIPFTIKGTIKVLLFKEESLTNIISKTLIEDIDASKVVIPKLRELQISIKNKEQINLNKAKEAPFSLSGSLKLVWKIDEEELAKSFANQKKKNFSNILSQYKNIDSAEATVRPFWKSAFPEDYKSIKIIKTPIE